MSQKNNSIQKLAKILLAGLTITLISCGGGGGSGSAYPSIQYTGVNTQATVTETNASDFPVAMLEGSTSSSDANPFGIAIETNNTKDIQHTAMLNIVAEQIKSDILSQQNNSDTNLVSAATQTSAGTCSPNPGSITVTDNSTTTNLSGSFTYNAYCVGFFGTEIELHGKVSYSGSLLLDGNDPIFQSMTITVEYLKYTVRTGTETQSEEFSGSMTLTFDGTISNGLASLSVTTNFEAGGLTYKIVNLNIDTSSGLNISGDFYHPTHGYVEVTTTTNFNLVGTNPDEYCGGTLRLEGAGGDVIDFTDTSGNCSTYMICVTPFGGSPSCQAGLAWP